MRLAICTLLFSVSFALTSFAQDKGMQAPTKQTIHYRPDFYCVREQFDKDTTYTFKCYDSRDSILKEDALVNFDKVKYVSMFKSYTDYAHKYKAKDGTEKPLPISQIVKRWDKAGKTRWLTVDYTCNKMGECVELQQSVIKSDTLPDQRIIIYFGHRQEDY